MMTNLFSIFDPSLFLFSFSWFIFFFFILLVPSFFWLGGNFSLSFSYFFMFGTKEIDYSISKFVKGVYSFIMSVFLTVSVFNFFAMFPFIFSVTSHLLVTFPLSYSFWLAVIFFFLYKSLSDFLSHLIPVGTPVMLMSFMVVVELLSNLIRPMALVFRLTANMMAGHLLLSLIGGSLISSGSLFLLFGSLIQSLLVFMELGVSFIQAYVFSALILLYLSETESH